MNDEKSRVTIVGVAGDVRGFGLDHSAAADDLTSPTKRFS